MVVVKRGIRTRLPNDFVPGKYTVLCGRGKEYTSSTGNMHLKSLVQKYLKPYSEANSKMVKSTIVGNIMELIKALCSDAAFVKLDNEGWCEVDDAFAREKVGCMFRDTLHTKYRSSTKAKFARKKANQTEGRRDSSSSSPSMAESIETMVSTLSSSSTETYASEYPAEIFGDPCPMSSEKAEPTILNAINDYYSLLTSYLTSGPNHQQQQQQQRKSSPPIDFCVMPPKSPSAFQQTQLGTCSVSIDFCVMPLKTQSAFHQQPQTQPRGDSSVQIDYCVMPSKTNIVLKPEFFDDIPDDLSGIFDDC